MIDKTKACLIDIKTLFPGKTKLNAIQACKCIGISSTTFNNIIKANELHRLPRFESESKSRVGRKYFIYKFSIYDIAEFNSK